MPTSPVHPLRPTRRPSGSPPANAPQVDLAITLEKIRVLTTVISLNGAGVDAALVADCILDELTIAETLTQRLPS
jgi:hypothetical protein